MRKDSIHIFQFATNRVCSPYRFEFPGRVLSRFPEIQITRFARLDAKIFETLLREADVLIVQRLPMSPRFAKICRALNARGKLVIFEIDDDLMHLPPDSGYAKKAPSDYAERIADSIRACQAVQCSTIPLARTISRIQPEVVVLENQWGPHLMPFREKSNPNRPLIIAYAAGEDHYLDWMTVRDKYNQVVGSLEAAGHCLETWVIGDRSIFDSITSPSKRFFPLLPRHAYLELMTKVDIALTPLADIPFNHCKSDVKFLEAAASGAAVLASNVVYASSIKHNETGFLYCNSEEFGNLLMELTQHWELVQTIARNAHDYVSKTRLIEQHISKWLTTYRDWYANRHRLLLNSSHMLVAN